MSFPILESLTETYTRHIRVGDSEAHLGLGVITALVRPFTPGEDAVVAWIKLQDDALLLDLVPLSDGRDYVVLRRQYTRQSYAEALYESQEFARLMLRFPKQRDTDTTRREVRNVTQA